MGAGQGFDDLGRELRQRIGGELRAEAHETERLVALQARRRASLADLARHAQARGDQVAVQLPGLRLTGTVVHAAGDLLSLDIHGQRIDVAVDRLLALRVATPGRAGAGRDATGDPPGFTARLLELEMAAQPVELVVRDVADPLPGVLVAVAVDHVALADPDGQEWAIALPAVLAVRTRRSRRGS